MLDYIIENFRKNSQFINDFDELEIYLANQNISFEEKTKFLREVFEYNNKIYSIICEDNKRLEKIISTRQYSKIKKVPEIRPNKVAEQKRVEVLNVDVSFYLHEIRECQDLDKIETVLPDRTQENYVPVFSTVLLKLYEEIIDIKKQLYIERKTIDSETESYFKNEIDQILCKINYIKYLMKHEVVKEEQQKNVNELVFLKTSYGNVCTYSDLKDIPADCYELFYELLESICDGTLKNFKTFTNNSLLKGLSEVKLDSARIIIDRISNNVYAVIYMFVKKNSKSASYHASLQNRNDLYQSSYEEMKSLSDNSEDYLEENRKIKEKIYNILLKENKVKKIGEING